MYVNWSPCFDIEVHDFDSDIMIEVQVQLSRFGKVPLADSGSDHDEAMRLCFNPFPKPIELENVALNSAGESERLPAIGSDWFFSCTSNSAP
jgi:hypothetical protein